jgi:histidine triad (HIT) family protein
MASIFSKIINKEIPSFKVAENDFCYAFLDINPLKKGHTLVVPKKEVDYLFDLEKSDYLNLQDFVRNVAIAIKKSIVCKRVAVIVLGFEVPHAHIHLIPIDHEDEVNFSNKRVKLSSEEMTNTAQLILDNFLI